MMIEEYLGAARRTKPTTEALVALYHKYYDHIKGHVSPVGGYPELFVTFSSERRCELVKLADRKYLVYDQCLGQSFNRLNRIQFSTHDSDLLSMAYACKYIAERLVTLGAIAPATFFGLISRQFEQNAHASGDPFAINKEDEALRCQLVAVQEMFVMAHELAHHRWALDKVALNAEMAEYLEDFFKSAGENHNGKESSRSLSAYYRNILDSGGEELFEEIFADDFGGLITMRAALAFGVYPWQASLGIILAFKYLRLFRHLEILSHKVAALAQSGQSVDFRSDLESVKKEIWDSEVGHIKRFQLREHFLRYRLRVDRESLPDYALHNESKIVEVVGGYDEKTEFPAVIGLVERLADGLTSSIFREIESSIQSAVKGTRVVDELTGWRRV